MVTLELITSLPVANQLGECPLWHPRLQQLYWTDIPAKKLYRYVPASGQLEVFDTPDQLASFGFIEGSDWLICGFAGGIARFEPVSGAVEWLYQLPDTRELRLNDGRVDREGRFWVGAMIENAQHRAKRGYPHARLYCCRGDGSASEHLGDIGISNSLCWSPDGTRMYFADSPRGEICSYVFDPELGLPGERQLFARVPEGIHPDGATVDTDGCLWSSHWGGSRLVRYLPTGEIAGSFPLPVSQPTCAAFGGESFDYLFVTSARCGLSEAQLDAEAGNLLIFRVDGARGLAETFFRNES